MLSLENLFELLKVNKQLTQEAMARDNFVRVYELSVHRICVKDCIIENLTNEKARARLWSSAGPKHRKGA